MQVNSGEATIQKRASNDAAVKFDAWTSRLVGCRGADHQKRFHL